MAWSLLQHNLIHEIFLSFKLMLYYMSDPSEDIGAVFDEHVKNEFVTKDVAKNVRTGWNCDNLI